MKGKIQTLVAAFVIGFVTALVMAERWRRIGDAATDQAAADAAAAEAQVEAPSGANRVVSTVRSRVVDPIAHGAQADLGRVKARRRGDAGVAGVDVLAAAGAAAAASSDDEDSTPEDPAV